MRSQLFEAKSALFIGAHPDDIEFYCGGLVYMLQANGCQVTFAVGTRGGKGYTGWMKRRLERLRTAHQHDSAHILGGAKVVLYDYSDKSLANDVQSYAQDLKTLIKNINPDVIFTWDPDFIYNPHSDHQAAAQAGRIASEKRCIYYYGTREPNVWIGFDINIMQIKIKALRAHRTETPWYYWMLIRGSFLTRHKNAGVKVGERYAEALRRLS